MKRIYFIGISGASMRALALFAKHTGCVVKGYDRQGCSVLEEEGVTIEHDENLESVEWADEIVYSSAFHESFSLISYAKSLNKPLKVRGQFLGEIAATYEKVIAVSGSHGKSSVTSMIYSILRVAGLYPSLHVGANLKESGRSFDISGKQFFVTEACEYHDNFLFLRPYLSIITNVEPEHLDYFKTFANEKKSFKKFKDNSEMVVEKTPFTVKNLKIDEFGNLVFDVYEGEERYFNLHLSVGGKYNAENSLFAIEAARKLGINKCLIKLGLESYKGIEKRFERMECSAPVKAIVDYAHHPHEIESMFNSIKELKGKKVALFQPHTYSRTASLMDDFVKVLSKFDEVILFKTYPAREEAQPEVEIELLKRIAAHKKSIMFYDLNALIERLNTYRDTILAIMGAGDLPELLMEQKFISREG